MSQLLLPPRTGEGGHFYDDDEGNDREAARLVREATDLTASVGDIAIGSSADAMQLLHDALGGNTITFGERMPGTEAVIPRTPPMEPHAN